MTSQVPGFTRSLRIKILILLFLTQQVRQHRREIGYAAFQPGVIAANQLVGAAGENNYPGFALVFQDAHVSHNRRLSAGAAFVKKLRARQQFTQRSKVQAVILRALI